MAEKIRYTRRDLKEPDEFFSTFGRAVAWCKENRSKVVAGTLGVVAVVALAFGTRAYLQWEENKASQELWPQLNRAQEILRAPSAADPSTVAATEQSLQALVNLHPDTRSTVYARYYLGAIAFARGDYDLALSRFRAGIATGKETGIMKFLLRQGIASSMEAKGDFIAASVSYREAGTFAGTGMKTQSRLGEARVLALAGKKTDAAALYRLILTENPETPLRDLVEIRLAQTE